jgi:hypothetical protein
MKKEVEIEEEKWICYEKYEEDYTYLGELPHRTLIKKSVDRTGKGVDNAEEI